LSSDDTAGNATGDATDDAADQTLVSLARELAERLAERYRIDAESAYASFVESWLSDRALREQAVRDPDMRRLKRTRAYKQAAEKVKTSTYNQLRTYKPPTQQWADCVGALSELAAEGVGSNDPRAIAARDQVVASHVSTRERLPDLEAFLASLFELAPHPTSILDVGCGLQPLLYPFHGIGSITSKYIGLDRDRSIVAAVDAWGKCIGDKRLQARHWSLSDGFAGVLGAEPEGRFSIALALKLIPVLARQERDLLTLFRDIPTRRLLISGAREAMVKRRNIERREKASLYAFANELGFEVLEDFETASELGLLLETR
jgi:hypothetical protein